MEKLEVEDGNVQVKNAGIMLTKKALGFIVIVITIVITGSILATYFGKQSCDNKSKIDIEKCNNLFCNDIGLLEGIEN